jgi:hypothetical protein
VIDIKIDTSDLKKFLAAVDRFEKTAHEEVKKIPLLHAQDYYGKIITNITANRYASIFPAYNPDYLKWKKKVSPSNSYWKLFGDLQANIVMQRKRKQAFSVGIKEGARTTSRLLPRMYGKNSSYSKRKSIEMIGRVLENGYGNIPARPLWKLTRDDYWKTGYIKRVKDSKTQLERSWY